MMRLFYSAERGMRSCFSSLRAIFFLFFFFSPCRAEGCVARSALIQQ